MRFESESSFFTDLHFLPSVFFINDRQKRLDNSLNLPLIGTEGEFTSVSTNPLRVTTNHACLCVRLSKSIYSVLPFASCQMERWCYFYQRETRTKTTLHCDLWLPSPTLQRTHERCHSQTYCSATPTLVNGVKVSVFSFSFSPHIEENIVPRDWDHFHHETRDSWGETSTTQ